MAVTGQPRRLLYAFPNADNGDKLYDIRTNGVIGVTTSSKGFLAVHRFPEFDVITRKRLPGLISAVIYNQEYIATIQGKKPFIYNTELGVVVGDLKRPVISTSENVIFNSMSCFEDQLVAVTTGSALCSWDLRSSDPPTVVTFPASLGLQSISASNYVIALGCSWGRIATLDTRNPKYRIATFEVAKRNDQIHVTVCEDEPWFIGFQCTGGLAGVFDTMSGQSQTYKAPQFEMDDVVVDMGTGRMRPVFAHSKLCAAYPWTRKIQIIGYGDPELQTVEAPSPVVALAESSLCDGVFAACTSGDVWHVM